MSDRLTRLAELSVHGANVQEGQIVMLSADVGLEEQVRATAAAAYKRGAKFVDVVYFDPPMEGLDQALVSKDTSPQVKELTKVIGDRSTNRVLTISISRLNGHRPTGRQLDP